MNLLRGWREFIEVYVQPSPNRPSTYKQTVKDKDDAANSRENIPRSDSRDLWDSDDDVPGTPPSFSHSQSQTSGETNQILILFLNMNVIIFRFIL